MKQLIHFFSLVNFALCKGGRGGGSFGGGRSGGGGPGGGGEASPEEILGVMLIMFCYILIGFVMHCLGKIGKILEERRNKAERERALRE